jgi:1A family penicillin-binding protein
MSDCFGASSNFRLASGLGEATSARQRLNYLQTPRLWSAVAIVIALALVAGVGLHRAWSTCGFQGCPDVSGLTSRQIDGASLLLDRNGETFANLLATEPRLVPVATLPATMRDAILAVEDRRFYEHAGVDWRRVIGAARANLRARRFEQGFSTITMQLARNLFPDRIPGRVRSLRRKLLEVRVAREIEQRFGKDEILELYLNHISFGQGASGIEAAARFYFGRPAASLSLSESALLAALPKAPRHYDPRARPEAARVRRDLVLLLMEKQGRVSPELARAARAEPLGVTPFPPPRAQDPLGSGHFAEAVRAELERVLGDSLYARPVRVWTTLDVAAQREAVTALETQLRAIEGGKLGAFKGQAYTPGPQGTGAAYLQGAIVMMDVRTGDVLAWLGGRDYGHSQFDRVAGARRLAGSAFKPFVYAAALSSGYALSQPLVDEPLSVPLSDGTVWEPKNFGGSYEGRVSVREALIASKNVPTVHLAQAVGRSRVAALAGRAGIDGVSLEPSMALGTVAVSPLELTAAYTAFAADGMRAAPRLVLRVETLDGRVLWTSRPARTAVVDAGVAFLVTEALRDAVDRGSGSRVRRAGFRGVAAGKTGTTNDGTDVWFVGYTPRIAAGVWIGFDEPRPIARGAVAGRLAAPVWGRLMASLARERGSSGSWPTPDGVVVRTVDPWSGLVLAEGCESWTGEPHREFFLAGWEPAAFCPGLGDPPAAGFWTDGRVSAPPRLGEEQLRAILARAEARRDQ